MEELPCFRIGGDQHNYLQVEVFVRSHPEQHDFWDGNWLDANISIQVGAFNGSYGASLRSDEFVRFLGGLQQVYSSLGTSISTYGAEFSALEEQLSIAVSGDALGHFTAQCVAVDNLGIGNRLEFGLTFDQTDIPAMISGLETILEAFPVRGSSSN